MATEIRVPTLGESITQATIARWFKKEGDAVAADEPLVELETDKVTVEVPAPAAGHIARIDVTDGATVEVGAVLGSIEDGAGAGAAPAAAKPAPAKSETPKAADAKPAPAPAAAKANGGAQTVEVVVPTLGESVAEATVGQWAKKVGDAVKADEILVSLETDKVAVDVPAPVAGRLAEIIVEAGATVGIGAALARIAAGEAGAAAAAPAPAAKPAPAAQPAAAPKSAAATAPTAENLSPSVRRIVTENAMDPASIPATGPGGRITKEDALNALEARANAPKEVPAALRDSPAPARAPGARPKAQLEERVKMTRLRQTIAQRLKEAQNTAAMLTTYNEVDMGPVMALRNKHKDVFEKKHGVKLGFMGFFAKACIAALKDIPAVNGEIEGTEIVYKNYYDIGVAVGTDKGLVVPVVRDADKLSLAGIERAIFELGKRARDGQLKIEDLQGGTFTISNGGVYGSLMSMPILNAPQSGILGMHKIEERPVVIAGKIEIRPMMYLALTYDHRIVDGKEAVTFLVRVKESLEAPERLLLDL